MPCMGAVWKRTSRPATFAPAAAKACGSPAPRSTTSASRPSGGVDAEKGIAATRNRSDPGVAQAARGETTAAETAPASQVRGAA